MRFRRAWLPVAVMALVAFAACGGEGEQAVAVSQAWARATPGQATTGAVYMELNSAEDRSVVAASVPDSVAGAAELHETVIIDASASNGDADNGDTDTDHGDTDHADHGNQTMTMRPVELIALPAGQTVRLMPGGLHVMLVDLVEPLGVGDRFDLTLTFGDAETQVIEVEVRLDPP